MKRAELKFPICATKNLPKADVYAAPPKRIHKNLWSFINKKVWIRNFRFLTYLLGLVVFLTVYLGRVRL